MKKRTALFQIVTKSAVWNSWCNRSQGPASCSNRKCIHFLYFQFILSFVSVLQISRCFFFLMNIHGICSLHSTTGYSTHIGEIIGGKRYKDERYMMPLRKTYNFGWQIKLYHCSSKRKQVESSYWKRVYSNSDLGDITASCENWQTDECFSRWEWWEGRKGHWAQRDSLSSGLGVGWASVAK